MLKEQNEGLQEALERIEKAKHSQADKLDLTRLKLTDIPDSLVELTNLRTLDVSENRLTSFPTLVARLGKLEELNLGDNRISDIPSFVSDLQNLSRLELNSNLFTHIPQVVTQLGNLSFLDVSNNKIAVLPETICNLVKLRVLVVTSAGLNVIPDFICQLKDLRTLALGHNEITSIPESIGDCLNLEGLFLHANRISAMPKCLTRLSNLRSLTAGNWITSIPKFLGEMSTLEYLNLGNNRLTLVPESLFNLKKLERLYLDGNQISEVPSSMTRLTNLKMLYIMNNPLPEEILAALRRGVSSLFRYLRATDKRKSYPRTVKLVLLGEPKSGKTTFLEALQGNPNPCDDSRMETLGVNVVNIEKQHPVDKKPMYLSAWDFAGQHIEHATHQFFLTENAIYLILWNARQGTESGKRDLWYWLELLKMRVRDPKFLLVATHTEHTPPDLNISEIERNYKGFQGHFSVELGSLKGFAAIDDKIRELAVESPSLRAEWPPDWLPVRDEIRKVREKQPYMTPAAFRSLLKRNRVTDVDERKDIAGQLHNLGEILYYQEREELSNLVILNPEWVTELIALVVRSKEVREQKGMLRKSDLDKLWKRAKLPIKVRSHLTSLMDWFDLTYSTGQRTELGIVVEALPYSSPDDLKQIELPTERPQMEMIFRFPSLQRHLPPGIPTWGIARAHRLSKCRPWRDAAAFEDRETSSQAIILSSDAAKEIRLRVAADYPPFFFGRLEAILRDTFKRYPGAEPERRLPCPCQQNCSTSHLYQTVLKRWLDRKRYVTCDKSGEDVSVESLLSGAKRTDTEEGLLALRADMRRLFTEHLRALNEQMENTCPSVFTLLPSREFTQLDTWIESITKQSELELVLYCEHDSGWHQTAHSVYRFRNDQEWFLLVKKGWSRFAGVTKYVGPLVKTAGKLSKILPLEAGGMALEKLQEAFSLGPDTFLQLGKKDEKELVDIETRYLLKELVEHLDQQRGNTKPKNGGLHPWLIDDGRLLWLCPDHLKQYRTRA